MKRATKIQLRAESITEAIHDGDPEGVAKFATYLDEVGDLASAMEELTPTTTVADMVDAYIQSLSGQRMLYEWAKDIAEAEQLRVEEDEAERRAA
ncbi:hypothetical protein SAMN04487867_104101 [Vreelandella titanicae]|uniref:hypothetical protein n=1 Tax=Vreelandella titanicae TaxID=664683 RepID=UPI00087EBE51|nr:hypothetical protein [Halomonas titanicae]SDI28643.1 hypothetical protein SAMN04487867_104101 [Halomonas titanicae]